MTQWRKFRCGMREPGRFSPRAAPDIRRRHTGLRPDAVQHRPHHRNRTRHTMAVRAHDREYALRSAEPAHHRIPACACCRAVRRRPTSCSAPCSAIGCKFVLRFDGKHIFKIPRISASPYCNCSNRCPWISPGAMAQPHLGSVPVFVPRMPCAVPGKACRHRHCLPRHVRRHPARTCTILGDPLAIPMKQMQSGALLLLTFFMITDPKTTPDRRSARMLYAVLVAAQRRGCSSPTTCRRGSSMRSSSLPARAAARPVHSPRPPGRALRVVAARAQLMETPMRNKRGAGAGRHPPLTPASMAAQPAQAFCGFYVAKAERGALQQSLQGGGGAQGRADRGNDGQRLPGRSQEFALVIPVPTVVSQGPDQGAGEPRSSTTSMPTAPRGWSNISILTPATRRCRTGDAGDGASCQRYTKRDAAQKRRARRKDRSGVHGRRIRHPDPLRLAERWPRHMAQRRRLQDAGGRQPRCSAPTSSRA